MKNLLLLSLLFLLLSCKMNHKSDNDFYQQFEYVINVYGDTLFNHFPEEMSLNPKNNKNIANVTYRLKTDFSTVSDSNNLRPIFLLYGEKYRKESKFNFRIEQLEHKNAIQINNNEPTCFYIFDFGIKNNQKYVCPFFADIEDDRLMPLKQSSANFYLDFNKKDTAQKKYPLPLLNDTILTLYYQYGNILSKNLTHYIVAKSNTSSWNDTINKNNSTNNYLSKKWQHGFSQGYSVSTKDRYILYWTIIW